MTTDQLHQAFHKYFNGQLTPTETNTLFTAAEHAGYLHMCSREHCPKEAHHG